MPSLFSKFRHRKSASQSSNTSDNSNPSSPRTSSSIARPSQGVPQAAATTHDLPSTRASTDLAGRRSEDVFGGAVGGGGKRLSYPSAPDLPGATGGGHGSGVEPGSRAGQDSQGPVGEGEVVVIGKQSHDPSGSFQQSSGRRDETGHSRPFVDESLRPDLPTTSSNVNNPIPVPASRTSGSTHYIPHSQDSASGATGPATTEDLLRKPLPAVPEVTTPSASNTYDGPDSSSFPLQSYNAGATGNDTQHGHGHGTFGHLAVDTNLQSGSGRRRLSESSGGPLVPPRSPQRSSISGPSPTNASHERERIHSPPLPHVASIDRSNLQREEEERPGLFGSSSRANRAGEEGAVAGDYPHVNDIPALRQPNAGQSHGQVDGYGAGIISGLGDSGRASPAGRAARKGDKEPFVEIPKRDSSLKLSEDNELKALMEGGTGGSSRASFTDDRSSAAAAHGTSALPGSRNVGSGTGYQGEDLSSRVAKMSLERQGQEALPGLKEQRKDLIVSLVEGSVSRAGERQTLTDEGREVFKKAGMGELLDREGTVDMASRVLDPVVKETIYPKEHTEYTTIITRCIHKTHYIPLIQPIHDPDPVVLATRHRIFSAEDGQWHEVIGDDAALEILGRDTFFNGPQERRELRKPALPGLEEMDEDAIRMSKEAGLYYSASSGSAGYTNTSMMSSGGEREFREDKQVAVPIRGEDVAYDGIGMGGGSGRVLEREYKLGEGGGEWQEVATYVGLEKGLSGMRLGGTGASVSKEDKNVGLAL
ncbi:hypothetical protein IAU59_004748 [Kwoniella sp. CBS 9459]